MTPNAHPSEDGLRIFGLAAQNGCTGLRVSSYRDHIDTASGSFRWAEWDGFASELRRLGLKALAMLGYGPRGSEFLPVVGARVPRYLDFCEAFVARYRDVLSGVSILNEGNHPEGKYGRYSPSEYVGLCKATYARLKPLGVQVFVGEFATGNEAWIDEAFRLGLTQHGDVLGWHQYEYQKPPTLALQDRLDDLGARMRATGRVIPQAVTECGWDADLLRPPLPGDGELTVPAPATWKIFPMASYCRCEDDEWTFEGTLYAKTPSWRLDPTKTYRHSVVLRSVSPSSRVWIGFESGAFREVDVSDEWAAYSCVGSPAQGCERYLVIKAEPGARIQFDQRATTLSVQSPDDTTLLASQDAHSARLHREAGEWGQRSNVPVYGMSLLDHEGRRFGMLRADGSPKVGALSVSGTE